MVFDERGDEEPDDPEFDVRDGSDLIPDPPDVEDPSGPAAEAPQEVKTTFWAVVLLVDVALACLVLGPVVIYFTGMTRVGYGMIAIGLFCAASAYRRYRSFARTADEELGVGSASDGPPSEEGRTDRSEPNHADSESASASDDRTA